MLRFAFWGLATNDGLFQRFIYLIRLRDPLNPTPQTRKFEGFQGFGCLRGQPRLRLHGRLEMLRLELSGLAINNLFARFPQTHETL